MGKDYTGQVFNRFTVLGKDYHNSRRSCWVVRCECGEIRSMELSQFNTGRRKSCGCLARERSSQRMKAFWEVVRNG